MTTPPRIRFATNGEQGREVAPLWDPNRLLHGLAVEVKPVARYLQSRLLGGSKGPPTDKGPTIDSLEILTVAVRTLRQAILESAEQGLDAERVRGLHDRLDRDFAALVLGVLDRRTADSRSLLSDVSHDLRSPLNSILFLADALATEHAGTLNEVQRRQVGVLYTAAVSLVGLLNDLIDVSHLGGAAAIEVLSEPFSVESVLRQVDHLVGPLAGHGDIELTFRLETLGPRHGDRRILTRILINLVSNAVHATQAGGRVELRAYENSDLGLRVEVTDTGADPDIEGIRELLRAAPFPSHGDRTRGWTHGLGLSICSRLVDAASGALVVQATSEGGCRFTLDLPFLQSTA